MLPATNLDDVSFANCNKKKFPCETQYYNTENRLNFDDNRVVPLLQIDVTKQSEQFVVIIQAM